MQIAASINFRRRPEPAHLRSLDRKSRAGPISVRLLKKAQTFSRTKRDDGGVRDDGDDTLYGSCLAMLALVTGAAESK
ncbi:MAG: hypothetical protein ACLQSR_09635 [Limisphaerales bacterium]